MQLRSWFTCVPSARLIRANCRGPRTRRRAGAACWCTRTTCRRTAARISTTRPATLRLQPAADVRPAGRPVGPLHPHPQRVLAQLRPPRRRAGTRWRRRGCAGQPGTSRSGAELLALLRVGDRKVERADAAPTRLGSRRDRADRERALDGTAASSSATIESGLGRRRRRESGERPRAVGSSGVSGETSRPVRRRRRSTNAGSPSSVAATAYAATAVPCWTPSFVPETQKPPARHEQDGLGLRAATIAPPARRRRARRARLPSGRRSSQAERTGSAAAAATRAATATSTRTVGASRGPSCSASTRGPARRRCRRPRGRPRTSRALRARPKVGRVAARLRDTPGRLPRDALLEELPTPASGARAAPAVSSRSISGSSEVRGCARR